VLVELRMCAGARAVESQEGAVVAALKGSTRRVAA
jgi:hypothetical protein